ncbi:MAG: polysaccharide deacetylase family protein [Vicinamibacterales bacterium]
MSAARARVKREALMRLTRGGDRPLLSLSLDLDNQWSYQKIHGAPGWEAFPSYLDRLVSILLDRLAGHRVPMTVFVVGQDAALERNHAALGRLATAGLEIGNHSFHHEPWLHLYSAQQMADEVARADDAIVGATGRQPLGFRGPGFSFSDDTLRVLAARGYLYDGSTFPTFLGPIARLYYFWKSRGLPAEEREKRARLFGTWREGFRPIEPYVWRVGAHRLVEIPVTTMPLVRLPIHLSYVLYLAGYSRLVARTYLRQAIGLCRLLGVEPSFLLHPLDLLGGEEVPALRFFPGMQLSTSFKVEVFDETIATLSRHFTIVTMEQHARALAARDGTPDHADDIREAR